MSKLYIANTTLQHQHLHYRVAEVRRALDVHIPPGQQKEIYKETDRDTLELIVEQLRTFGLVAAHEIDRTKRFIGMCYSFDKPVQVDAIMRAQAHNHDVLETESAETLNNGAAAVADQLARQSQQMGVTMTATETEIIQESGGEKGADQFAHKVRAEIQPARNNRKGR